MNEIQTKIKGHQLNISAGAGSSTTTITPVESDGKVIGLALASPYAESDVSGGLILVTISQGDNKAIDRVPITQLIPNAERKYIPIQGFNASGEIAVTVESFSANTLTTKKPVLSFYFLKK